jgi:integrase
MTTVVRNVSMVCGERRWRRLPVVTFDRWVQDARSRDVCPDSTPRITEKGYRKGCKPGNAGIVYDDFEIPTDEEIQQLIDACDTRRVSGRRQAALIAFLRGTGLRINEALDFLPADLNAEKGIVLVQCGKGGKRARCGITPNALAATLEWMDDRKAAGFTDDQPLFPVVEGETRGRKMYQAYVRASLRELARKAGVEKRCNPHCFRHALALDMDKRRIPLTIISKQLRHGNVATTATYLKKLSDTEVYDTLAGMEWLAVLDAPEPVESPLEVPKLWLPAGALA